MYDYTIWISTKVLNILNFTIQMIYDCSVFRDGFSDQSKGVVLHSPEFCGNTSSSCHRCIRMSDPRFCQPLSITILPDTYYSNGFIYFQLQSTNIRLTKVSDVFLVIDGQLQFGVPNISSQLSVQYNLENNRNYSIQLFVVIMHPWFNTSMNVSSNVYSVSVSSFSYLGGLGVGKGLLYIGLPVCVLCVTCVVFFIIRRWRKKGNR